MAATSEPLTTAPLTGGHAEAAFALSTEAGWNQSLADWRLMIEEGEAWGQFAPSGELVASALILPYARKVAWIAMVLTTAAQRRRGLATQNLYRALDRSAMLGVVAGLDATPAGREVYRPLGFRDVFPLQRVAADSVRLESAPAPGAVAIRPLDEADLDAAIGLDAEVFGARRPHILRHLWSDQPGRAHLAEADGRAAGLVLARQGRLALHLGPIYATSVEVAVGLAARALNGVRGPVSVDVPDAQTAFASWLERSGFRPVRPFMRMLRGDLDLGDPGRAFAIAGPELG